LGQFSTIRQPNFSSDIKRSKITASGDNTATNSSKVESLIDTLTLSTPNCDKSKLNSPKTAGQANVIFQLF